MLENHAFEDLPVALLRVFGEPAFVMDLELSSNRKLAYEDIHEVMENLADQGYHLQMPPQEDPGGLLELPEKKETLL
mgnify:CR=1 FL=1